MHSRPDARDVAATAMAPVATPVQILSVIFYAGFAIAVSIVAMAMFGLIGVLLAVLFAWQWGRIPALGEHRAEPGAAPQAAESRDRPQPTGNASFDAYRDQTLRRLEAERAQFEGFLERLRRARDAEELDRFLEERAGAAGSPSETAAA
jgi:hypothetical protein